MSLMLISTCSFAPAGFVSGKSLRSDHRDSLRRCNPDPPPRSTRCLHEVRPSRRSPPAIATGEERSEEGSDLHRVRSHSRHKPSVERTCRRSLPHDSMRISCLASTFRGPPPAPPPFCCVVRVGWGGGWETSVRHPSPLSLHTLSPSNRGFGHALIPARTSREIHVRTRSERRSL